MCAHVPPGPFVNGRDEALGPYYRGRGLKRVDNLGCVDWLKITSFCIYRGCQLGVFLLSRTARTPERTNGEHEVRHITGRFQGDFKSPRLLSRWVEVWVYTWNKEHEVSARGLIATSDSLVGRAGWCCREISLTRSAWTWLSQHLPAILSSFLLHKMKLFQRVFVVTRKAPRHSAPPVCPPRRTVCY